MRRQLCRLLLRYITLTVIFIDNKHSVNQFVIERLLYL